MSVSTVPGLNIERHFAYLRREGWDDEHIHILQELILDRRKTDPEAFSKDDSGKKICSTLMNKLRLEITDPNP